MPWDMPLPPALTTYPENNSILCSCFWKGCALLFPPIEVAASEPKLQAAEINASKQVSSWELTQEVLQKYCKSESVMGIIYLQRTPQNFPLCKHSKLLSNTTRADALICFPCALLKNPKQLVLGRPLAAAVAMSLVGLYWDCVHFAESGK